MNWHEPKLAGNSKDLPMGVNMLSFHSFHCRFSERPEFPYRGQTYKRAEQVGHHLGASAGKRGAEAAGSGGLWRSWEEIFLRSSFRDQFPPVFLLPRYNGPWEMLSRLVLEKESSRDLFTLSSAERVQLQSHFINYLISKPHKVWIYLLALPILMPSPKFRAKVQKCWILRVTDTKLLSCSSPLQRWCGPDLLQGDLSTAPSRCKALRHRNYGAPSSRRGSVHHLHIPDQLQHPGSLLTTAALSKAERLISLKICC